METFIMIFLLILLLVSLYKNYKKLTYFSLFCIFCVILYVLYKKFFSKSFLKEEFEFSFRNDDENIKQSPELYCGDSSTFDRKIYDKKGTRYTCMRKGIGIGMNLPDEQREEFLSKPYSSEGKEKLYCGNDLLLPENYDRFGSNKECLKKGVGAGLAMPQEKRLRAQQKASTKLGKREIFNLAQRLKINTDDLTRKQSILSIANKLIQLNA